MSGSYKLATPSKRRGGRRSKHSKMLGEWRSLWGKALNFRPARSQAQTETQNSHRYCRIDKHDLQHHGAEITIVTPTCLVLTLVVMATKPAKPATASSRRMGLLTLPYKERQGSPDPQPRIPITTLSCLPEAHLGRVSDFSDLGQSDAAFRSHQPCWAGLVCDMLMFWSLHSCK